MRRFHKLCIVTVLLASAWVGLLFAKLSHQQHTAVLWVSSNA